MANDTGPAADIAAIRESRAAIERSVNERDADGIGRHLAEDVAQLPADGQVHGRAAAVEEHHRIFRLLRRGLGALNVRRLEEHTRQGRQSYTKRSPVSEESPSITGPVTKPDPTRTTMTRIRP
jgi:hypothetical protein